jgi:lysophospholipid acyltransferase (LPLAT)-like uncharacterized protein
MSEPRRRTSGPVVPHRPTFGQRLAARLVYGLIRGNCLTHRFRVVDTEGGLATAWREPVIFAVWHNRLAYSVYIHWRFVRAGVPERRMAAMVSASRDGAFLSAVLQEFQVEPVRGSTSRRGPQALIELRSWADRGLDLAITPDGPRGPAYRVQPGVVAIAAITGRAIVPVSLNTTWKASLRSWDRFQIPLPFGACEVRFGAPVRVASNAAEALEAARLDLERGLASITLD